MKAAEIFQAELHRNMALLDISTIDEFTSEHLMRLA
ncbi:isopentenyl diphosphate isomerase/L-lactate dehydrogenase-like FMN-dependent dehydrogenase [Rhizobium sp. BK181]|nr:isopentenyl diphosphate isomerase/L-lactate dehydrogenase-like FMN-dependent dehydrogenase [Rhizobium sp. BK181]